MRITVRVQPKASARKVVSICDGGLKVYITAPPCGGQANRALIELLAEHLNVSRSSIKIVKGQKSKNKIIEVRQVHRSMI